MTDDQQLLANLERIATREELVWKDAADRMSSRAWRHPSESRFRARTEGFWSGTTAPTIVNSARSRSP